LGKLINKNVKLSTENIKMTRRAYYKRQVYYGEDFEKELEQFERNIAVDEKHFKAMKTKHRFSAVIRHWIKSYNTQFAKEELTVKS
jgi:ectoine hydroxylase-related dioxygenase (phytanoyl-CoA dioxygenase family)